MQRDTGNVLWEDASLKRPYSVPFRLIDERAQKLFADPAVLVRCSYIDRDLSDSRINRARRDWT